MSRTEPDENALHLSDVPEDVQVLAGERAALRAARDYAGADAVRDAISALGFDVADGPDGPTFRARDQQQSDRELVSPEQVLSVLAEPAEFDVSIQWVVQSYPDDVTRAVEAFRATTPERLRIQEVIVDCIASAAADYPTGTEVIRLASDPGWGIARNLGLVRSRGHVVVIIDGSVEPTGDALFPVIEALGTPEVGVVGPFGIVTPDLNSFEESPGPDVDAIEGYLMGFRRERLSEGMRFDEKFRFYRTADIEFCFQLADRGFARRVIPLPVTRHEHRMWHHTEDGERERLSKRNFYRFLDTFRGRFDLTVGGSGAP